MNGFFTSILTPACVRFGKLFDFEELTNDIEYSSGEIVSPVTFSFPCPARGSFEMRNYIISSIANVVRRYRAAAVDMLRIDLGSPAFQWHAQLFAVVQPAGNVHQKRYRRLLTNVVKVNDSSIDLNRSLKGFMTSLSERVNERLFEGMTGGNCQLCLTTTSGSSGSSRVS